MSNSVISIKAVENIILSLAASTPEIQMVRYGDKWKANTSRIDGYPLLMYGFWGLEVATPSPQKAETTVDVFLCCLDQIMEGRENVVDAQNKAFIILTDFYMKLKTDVTLKGMGFKLPETSVQIREPDLSGDDSVYGAMMVVKISLPLNICKDDLPYVPLVPAENSYSPSNPSSILCSLISDCPVIGAIQDDIATLFTLTGGTGGGSFSCSALTTCPEYVLVSGITYQNQTDIAALSGATTPGLQQVTTVGNTTTTNVIMSGSNYIQWDSGNGLANVGEINAVDVAGWRSLRLASDEIDFSSFSEEALFHFQSVASNFGADFQIALSHPISFDAYNYADLIFRNKHNNAFYSGTLSSDLVLTGQTWHLPNNTGTIALREDLSQYLHVTGGTGGDYTFTGVNYANVIAIKNALYMFDQLSYGVPYIAVDTELVTDPANFWYDPTSFTLTVQNIRGFTMSGGFIFSGGTNIQNLFAPMSSVHAPTRVVEGINIFTGGTIAAPTINLNGSIVLTGVTASSISGTSVTAATLASTTAVITTLNSSTGNIVTLSGTTGTLTTLNASTGNVVTLSGTTGTLTTLNSTTASASGNLSGGTIFEGGTSLVSKYAPKDISITSTSGSSGTYTLVLTDDSRLVDMTGATAQNLVVPSNANVAFPIGSQVMVAQTGAGQVTFSAATGVSILSYLSQTKTIGQYAAASLVKKASDTWILAGNLTT